jgi:hypothetical protein
VLSSIEQSEEHDDPNRTDDHHDDDDEEECTGHYGFLAWPDRGIPVIVLVWRSGRPVWS